MSFDGSPPGRRVSVVIPYKARLRNLEVALTTLAGQTMGGDAVEVVVGAMEYSPEYVALCHRFAGRLDIVSVLADEPWSPSRARNLALAQVRGEVVLFLDADMAVPSHLLDHLYRSYFAHGQRVCVIGQMVGYDELSDRDTADADVAPDVGYRKVLADLEAAGVPRSDRRWTPPYAEVFRRTPWALARTALVALPAALVREHGLTFDEGFHGWGPEDQEWAYRVSRTGTPLLLRRDVWAVHLPHARDVTADGATAWANNRYYLRKWPRRDLELALAFGWVESARVYPDVERRLAAAAGDGGTLAVLRGDVDGRDTLVVGAVTFVHPEGHPDTQPEVPAFDVPGRLDVLPLAGFGLPYADGSVAECRVLGPVLALPERYRDAILREAGRVAATVTPVA